MGFGGLLAAAAERDPAGTMAFIEQHRQLAHEATKAFRVWLQRDAAAACAWLGSTKVRDSLQMRDLIADIAALAPAQLDAVMASMPEGSQGLENAKRALAALEVDRDPGAALAKFPSLPAEDRQRMMEPLALHLAARGTAAEITGFLGSLTADKRSDFFGNLSENLSYGETERLLSLVRRPELTDTEKARLLSKASHLEPQHAEELMALLYHKDSPYSSSAAGFWTANLSRAPDETLPILSRMAADGRVDAALLRSITAQISRHDSTGAARMVAALPVSLQAEPRALLAAQAALSGDSTAIADFSSLPTTEARQETLRAIFNDRQGEYDAVRRAARPCCPSWTRLCVPARAAPISNLPSSPSPPRTPIPPPPCNGWTPCPPAKQETPDAPAFSPTLHSRIRSPPLPGSPPCHRKRPGGTK